MHVKISSVKRWALSPGGDKMRWDEINRTHPISHRQGGTKGILEKILSVIKQDGYMIDKIS